MDKTNVGSWKRKKMMNPEGKIGTVVIDYNPGVYRILTVKFDDRSVEDLWLANGGPNPEESWKWKWLHKHDGKEEWVEWGK